MLNQFLGFGIIHFRYKWEKHNTFYISSKCMNTSCLTHISYIVTAFPLMLFFISIAYCLTKQANQIIRSFNNVRNVTFLKDTFPKYWH